MIDQEIDLYHIFNQSNASLKPWPLATFMCIQFDFLLTPNDIYFRLINSFFRMLKMKTDLMRSLLAKTRGTDHQWRQSKMRANESSAGLRTKMDARPPAEFRSSPLACERVEELIPGEHEHILLKIFCLK